MNKPVWHKDEILHDGPVTRVSESREVILPPVIEVGDCSLEIDWVKFDADHKAAIKTFLDE
jgi:hypothetical protein